MIILFAGAACVGVIGGTFNWTIPQIMAVSALWVILLTAIERKR